MPPGPSEFDLFPRLPPELRLQVWDSALEDAGDVVSISRLPGVYERKLPAISRVSRESRLVFLQHYVQLPNKTIYISPQTDGHKPIYINPQTDGLILDDEAFCRRPVLGESVTRKIHDVRLHMSCYAFRISYMMTLMHSHAVGIERPCPRLPDLRFPNLDIVWIVGASCGEKQRLPKLQRNLAFRYMVDSGEAYESNLTPEELSKATRILSDDRPSPDEIDVIRVDFVRTDKLDWNTKEWTVASKDDQDISDWDAIQRIIKNNLGSVPDWCDCGV